MRTPTPLYSLYARMLRLYPPRFRAAFAAEMQAVFERLCEQAAQENAWTPAAVFLREVKDLPFAALREHWRERKEQYAMENLSQRPTEAPTPIWAIVAIVGLFVIPGLLEGTLLVSLPVWLVTAFVVFFLLFSILLPLGIGLYTRLPRWSLVYIGIILGGVGIYGILTSLDRFLGRTISSWLDWGSGSHTLAWRLVGQWRDQGLFWLCILLAVGLFAGLLALFSWSRALLRRIGQDFTLLSFLLYGAILIIFFIDFDEYRFESLYRLGCLASLAAGAWGYLRATTPGRRTLALLAGLSACMAIMGVGKYFLVPLQEWSEWFAYYPPETERWFESLRTIATWFWAALVVGLPGLVQVLRKQRKQAEQTPQDFSIREADG